MAGILVMIWGVQSQGWYFTEIAVVFLAVSYLLFLVSGLSEHRFMESFVSGAADLLGVALTVGLARAVSIVMDESHTSDTILYFFSKQITGMNKLAFVWVLFLIYIVLGFFIQSSKKQGKGTSFCLAFFGQYLPFPAFTVSRCRDFFSFLF